MWVLGAMEQSGVLRDKLGLWESKLAPLSDSQREAFTTLSAAVSVVPSISEVYGEDGLYQIYVSRVC